MKPYQIIIKYINLELNLILFCFFQFFFMNLLLFLRQVFFILILEFNFIYFFIFFMMNLINDFDIIDMFFNYEFASFTTIFHFYFIIIYYLD
jgi:hypothetical protein